MNTFFQENPADENADPDRIQGVFFTREQSFLTDLIRSLSIYLRRKYILAFFSIAILVSLGIIFYISYINSIKSAPAEEDIQSTQTDMNAIIESLKKRSIHTYVSTDSSRINQLFFASPTVIPTIVPTQIPTPTPTPTPSPSPSPTPTPTPTPVWGPPGSEFKSMTIATERGNVNIDVISINIGDSQMITDTANEDNCGNDCPTKSLSNYISANGGFAGINGTYFCPPDYPECSSKKNSFDFPVYNSRLNKWINGGNMFWNDRSIIYQDGNVLHFNRDAKQEWYLTHTGEPVLGMPKVNLKAAIVNSPGLLENGNVIADQFPLTDKQKGKGTKGGIGFNENKVFLVIGKNVGMVDFGYVFKALGARYALNLDGGGSSALWYGRYNDGPGRSLPNAVVFRK